MCYECLDLMTEQCRNVRLDLRTSECQDLLSLFSQSSFFCPGTDFSFSFILIIFLFFFRK